MQLMPASRAWRKRSNSSRRLGSPVNSGGIQNYFVDLPLMQASVPYLKQLQA
jgi:hypothetical protein